MLLNFTTSNLLFRHNYFGHIKLRYYELGTAYGHIAIGVDDIYATVEAVRQAGGKVTREAGPVLGGRTVIAFVEDPDGYKIEFIANKDAQKALG